MADYKDPTDAEVYAYAEDRDCSLLQTRADLRAEAAAVDGVVIYHD